jgi:hypothetical protein
MKFGAVGTGVLVNSRFLWVAGLRPGAARGWAFGVKRRSSNYGLNSSLTWRDRRQDGVAGWLTQGSFTRRPSRVSPTVIFGAATLLGAAAGRPGRRPAGGTAMNFIGASRLTFRPGAARPVEIASRRTAPGAGNRLLADLAERRRHEHVVHDLLLVRSSPRSSRCRAPILAPRSPPFAGNSSRCASASSPPARSSSTWPSRAGRWAISDDPAVVGIALVQVRTRIRAAGGRVMPVNAARRAAPAIAIAVLYSLVVVTSRSRSTLRVYGTDNVAFSPWRRLSKAPTRTRCTTAP